MDAALARHRRAQAAALGYPRPGTLVAAILYDLDALFDQYGFSSDGDLKKCTRPCFLARFLALSFLSIPSQRSADG